MGTSQNSGCEPSRLSFGAQLLEVPWGSTSQHSVGGFVFQLSGFFRELANSFSQPCPSHPAWSLHGCSHTLLLPGSRKALLRSKYFDPKKKKSPHPLPKKWASFPFLRPEPQPAGPEDAGPEKTVTVLPVSPCQAGSHPCQQHLLIRARRRYGQGAARAADSGGAEAGSGEEGGMGKGHREVGAGGQGSICGK